MKCCRGRCCLIHLTWRGSSPKGSLCVVLCKQGNEIPRMEPGEAGSPPSPMLSLGHLFVALLPFLSQALQVRRSLQLPSVASGLDPEGG